MRRARAAQLFLEIADYLVLGHDSPPRWMLSETGGPTDLPGLFWKSCHIKRKQLGKFWPLSQMPHRSSFPSSKRTDMIQENMYGKVPGWHWGWWPQPSKPWNGFGNKSKRPKARTLQVTARLLPVCLTGDDSLVVKPVINAGQARRQQVESDPDGILNPKLSLKP